MHTKYYSAKCFVLNVSEEETVMINENSKKKEKNESLNDAGNNTTKYKGKYIPDICCTVSCH